MRNESGPRGIRRDADVGRRYDSESGAANNYFRYYWVGDYAPELRRVLEQAWIRACGGTIDSGDLAANRSALEDLVAFYNDESIGVVANCSTLALRIAQCLEASTDA